MTDVVREIEIEQPASAYAESRGWFEFKIEKASKRAIPDRFYARKGVVILVEYKRPGEVPSRQQQRRINELRQAGVTVHVIDNMQTAIGVFH